MKNQQLNLFVVQKNVEEQMKKPETKKQILMFEYKLLLLYTAQYGIYLIPQLDNFQIWHGVVFVRNGLYKQGKFKFKVTFPDFPNKQPNVIFISEVYHPLVNIETGQLDLQTLLDNKWNYGTQNLLCGVFEKIKSIFTDVKKLDISQSFNPQAHQLYKSSIQQFYMKVINCVQKSKQNLYDNYDNTSLRFSETNSQHTKISQQLSNICGKSNLTLQQKKKHFMKFLLQ